MPINTRICIKLLYFTIALFAILCFSDKPALAEDRVKVIITGGDQNEVYLPARFYKGIDFVPVRKLADLLEARTYYNSLAKKIVLYLGNHKVKVTALNPFIMIDNNVLQMPIDTDFIENDIWVPLNYFIDLIANYSPVPVYYDPDKQTLSMVREGINITAVNLEEKVNGTLIRIRTLRKFDLSNLSVRLSEGWLYVDIYGGKIDSTRLMLDRPRGNIRKLIPVMFEESTQLSFRLKQEVEREDISLSSNEREILVSVQITDEIPDDLIVDLKRERKKWMIDKIIIDPGHGGKHPGTVGYRNTLEKDIVLDISKRLKKLIQKRLDVTVLMTRESDKFMGLRERSEFANLNGGKLFVSIHANGLENPSAYGFETYCLGVAKTERDRKIAEKENAVIRYEDSWAGYKDLTNENYILRAIAQSSFNKESQELAGLIQRSASKVLKTKSRGVKQAGFIVLIGTSMPKILVEVGFLTNPNEASRLRSSNYRQKVAEAIFKGIETFKENSESAVMGNVTNHQ